MNKKIMIIAATGIIGSFAHWYSRAQPSPMPQNSFSSPAQFRGVPAIPNSQQLPPQTTTQNPFPSLTNPGAIPSSRGVPDMPHSSKPLPSQTTPPQSTTRAPLYNAAPPTPTSSQTKPAISSSFTSNAPSAPQPSSFSSSQPMSPGAMNYSNPVQQNESSIIRTANELKTLIDKVKNNIADADKLIPSEIDTQDKQKIIAIIEQEKANQEQELKQLSPIVSTYNKVSSNGSSNLTISQAEWSTFKTNIERVHKATLMLDYIKQLEAKIK